MGKMKKVLSAFLAVVVLATLVVVPTLAAESPKWGTYQDTSTGAYMVSSTTGKHNMAKKKTATKAVKSDTVQGVVVLNGMQYKVTKIGAHCYSGCKNLTKINIKSKYIYKCNKKAFKGLTKAQKQKIKVVVTKKLPTKKYNALVKALVAAGIPKQNISRSKTW